jgi:4-amino-4-deoxy-L-arabinose transferase-like glycosyltransferase
MQPRPSSAHGRRSSLGLLVLLLLFLSIGNATWFQLGGRPLHWDSAIHLSESLNANRVGEDTIRPYWKQFLYVSWYYPPFVSYASIPFYRLFGESEFTGSLIMSFFLVLLVASVYGIALQFFDQDVAIISAFLISMCSIVIEFSRDFMLDLPLASMVALSMFLLYASREFKNTFVSTLFGISLGLGFLTKWTFIFFLAIPLLCVFLQTIKRTPERFVHIRNLLLSILVGTAISAPWYLVHILQILMGRLGELGRGERSIFHDIIYYLEVIPGQVSWLLSIVLVAGIVLYLKYHRKPHLGLLAWFIGSYAIISVLSFKQPRFSIPLLPPLVIAASAGIVGWRNHSAAKPKHRSLVVQSVLTVVLVQYFLITFIPRMSGIGRTLNQPLLSASLVPVRGPSDAKWQQDEILRAVEEQIKKSPKLRAILRVIPDHSYFNRQTFEYFSELHRLPIVVSGSTSLPLFTDYVVVKTGDLGEDAAHRQVLSEHVIENSHQSNPLFTEIKRFPLPDGSEALLFRATPQRADDVSDVLILKKFERLADKFIKKYVRPVGEYSLHAAAYDSAETVRGHVKSLRIRAKQVELGDFAFEQVGVLSRDLDLKLFDIVFDPASLIQRDSLQILSLAGLHINGLSIEANGLQDYVEASSKGKTIVERLSMNDGILQLEVHQLKPNLTIDARVRLWNVDHRNLSFAFEETQISSIPIHPAIINILTDSFNPLLTGFGYLSDFRVGHLTLSNGELRIQSEKED